MATFYHTSAKRSKYLENALKAFGDKSRSRMPSMSETRWTERHDSLESFRVMLPSIIASLQQIYDNDTSGSIDASFFLRQ